MASKQEKRIARVTDPVTKKLLQQAIRIAKTASARVPKSRYHSGRAQASASSAVARITRVIQEAIPARRDARTAATESGRALSTLAGLAKQLGNQTYAPAARTARKVKRKRKVIARKTIQRKGPTLSPAANRAAINSPWKKPRKKAKRKTAKTAKPSIVRKVASKKTKRKGRKLTGAAKAAFLARMAKGRRK